MEIEWKPEWDKYKEWVRYVVLYPSGWIYLYEDKPNELNEYPGNGRWYCERIEIPTVKVYERPRM